MNFESEFVKEILEGGEEELINPTEYEILEAEEIIDYYKEEYGKRRVAR